MRRFAWMVLVCLVLAGVGFVAFRRVSAGKEEVKPFAGAVALSPDGRQGAVVVWQSVADLSKPSRMAVYGDGKLVFLSKTKPGELLYDAYPVWSRDGRRLAWMRIVLDGTRLFTRTEDGVVRSVSINGLADEQDTLSLSGWFPDGKSVLMRANSPFSGRSDFRRDSSFWRVSAADGRATCIARCTGKRAGVPFFSAAWVGETLFFLYGRELYVKRDGADAVRVPNLGEVSQIASDGRERLLVLSKAGSVSRILEVRPGSLSSPTLLYSGRRMGFPQYGPDGAVFLVKSEESGKSAFCLLRDGKLTSLYPMPSRFSFSVSRNGRVWVLWQNRLGELVVRDGRVVEHRPVELGVR